MQGKGFIKFLLYAVLAVCLLQYLFMIPTANVEKKANKFAISQTENIADDAERTRVQRSIKSSYLDSMSSEKIFSIPLFKDYTYDELKKQNLALGLDLKGGQSVALQVNTSDLILNLTKSQSGTPTKDPDFLKALDNANAAMKSSQSDFVTLFRSEFSKLGTEKKLARFFMPNEVMNEKINVSSTDGEVVRELRSLAKDVVSVTFNRLRQRIDKLGVSQPNVSLDAGRDIILVELPGVDNPKRARDFLVAGAALEFWDVYLATDPGIMSAFQQADDLLQAQLNSERAETSDSLGNNINLQGPLLSMLQVGAAGSGGRAVVGITDRNKKEAVMSYLNREDIKQMFPQDAKFLWSAKPVQDFATGENTRNYELYIVKTIGGTGQAPMEGDVVTSASQSPDPTTGQIAVSLSMNSAGIKKWAEMTTKAANAGNKPVAIALDNEIVTAPNVQGAILGGRTQITGNFTVAEASDLASILEVGKLPAKVEIIQFSNVGPSLGAKNISSSFRSYAIGLLVILLFMVFYYGGAGIISIIALIANLFFIIGALASFGTVLTLPGIAGLLLTIGMAVDANVIIYERIREELRAGKTQLQAIQDGFQNSYSAIIDANVTTILVAVILAYFGLGPIKGFAVVLIIGVLMSLFTAVLLGKLMIDWWTQSRGKELTFWTGPSKNAFANMNIDWIGKRKIAYIISGTVIALGIASMATKGFDLGVDFKGGYSYNVEFADGVDIDRDQLEEGLATVFDGKKPTVKAVDASKTYKIVTDYLIDETGTEAVDKVVKALHTGIDAIQGGGLDFEQFKSTDDFGSTHITSSGKVGPTIADDILTKSAYAGIFALLAIFLYIGIRFNKWQFSLGAVAALFHDSLIVLGIFSICWGWIPIEMEVDQVFIAALLTVIGYSINDTVVVFDRIREYLGIYTNKSTDEVLNMAINSTFSRTVITSLTTLFVVLVLLLFGGGAIKGFAFALFIGIIVGTYSSIFVATPIVRDLTQELKSKNAAVKAPKRFSKALDAQ